MELRVASPCTANWDRMQGDERVRYCPECKLNVYNFGAMDTGEIERLVRAREGRLCARFYTRPDGTHLTQNCPVGFCAKVQRVSRKTSALLYAAMSVAFAGAQTNNAPITGYSHARLSQATLELQVVDPSGAVVPNAQVSILDRTKQTEYSGTTDGRGRVLVEHLGLGAHSVIVIEGGFSTYRQDFEVRAAQTLKLTATLKLGLMGEVVEVNQHNFLHRLKNLF